MTVSVPPRGNLYTVSTMPFFFCAINDVSLELTLCGFASKVIIFELTTEIEFGLTAGCTGSCGGVDNTSIVPKREGVCDRDVAREEVLDAGLELRE